MAAAPGLAPGPGTASTAMAASATKHLAFTTRRLALFLSAASAGTAGFAPAAASFFPPGARRQTGGPRGELGGGRRAGGGGAPPFQNPPKNSGHPPVSPHSAAPARSHSTAR